MRSTCLALPLVGLVLQACWTKPEPCDTAYGPLPEGPIPLVEAGAGGDSASTATWPLHEDLRAEVTGDRLTLTYTDADGRAVTVVYRMEPDE